MLLRFIINTNIFISLAAVALTIETQVQLGMAPQLHPYLFIIFFATIFEYNLHRLITILNNPQALSDDKHKWVKKSPTAFYALVACSVIGFLFAAVMARRAVLIALFPIGLITLFYSLPVFKNNSRAMRLREIPLLKIFLIAFVWAASTILLPVIQSGQHFSSWQILCLLTERLVFVFAITLPFDIRDMKTDERSGLRTIPLLLGEKKTIQMSVIALLLFLLIAVLHYSITQQFFILTAMLLSALSTIFFVTSRKIQAVANYHYFVLDGTMLLQGILVWLSYYLKPDI